MLLFWWAFPGDVVVLVGALGDVIVLVGIPERCYYSSGHSHGKLMLWWSFSRQVIVLVVILRGSYCSGGNSWEMLMFRWSFPDDVIILGDDIVLVSI